MNGRNRNALRDLADITEHFYREFHVTQGSFRTSNSVNEQVLMLRFNDLHDTVVRVKALLEEQKESSNPDTHGDKSALTHIIPYSDDSDLSGRGYDMTRSPNEFSMDYGSE